MTEHVEEERKSVFPDRAAAAQLQYGSLIARVQGMAGEQDGIAWEEEQRRREAGAVYLPDGYCRVTPVQRYRLDRWHFPWGKVILGALAAAAFAFLAIRIAGTI